MATIVYPPTIDFNWLYQRPQQILKEIAAQGFNVIFYNNDYYFKQKKDIEELYPNFFLCKPQISLNRLNIDKPIILWISYPPHVNQIGRYGEDIVIFDAIDEASGEFISWAKDLDRITRKADIIFTTAEKLYNYHSKKHKDVYMCPNGTDFAHFNKARKMFSQRPKDLPTNDRPIIGYYGAIAPWIDWNIIRYISQRNRDFNFVMIGPLYGRFKGKIDAKNIYYLGRKEYDELPRYLQYFDICIIPFKVTPMIESCNPIKMYEYLSAGKGIVTTNMPETSKINEIYIGKSKEEFNQKIHEALLDKNNIKKINTRIEIAKNNSWVHRAITVKNIIEETFGGR